MPEESVLANDVLDELRAEPGIDANRLSVSASDGVVMLSGSANSYLEKTLAEHAVLRVVGGGLAQRMIDAGEIEDFGGTDGLENGHYFFLVCRA